MNIADIIQQVQLGQQKAANGDIQGGLQMVEQAYDFLKSEFSLEPENANIALWILEARRELNTPNIALIEMCEAYLEGYGNKNHLLQNLLGRYQAFLSEDVYINILTDLELSLIDAFYDFKNCATQNLALFEDGLSQSVVNQLIDTLKKQSKQIDKLAAFVAGRDYCNPETGEEEIYVLTLKQINAIAEKPENFSDQLVSAALGHIVTRQMMGEEITQSDIIRLKIKLKPHLPHYKEHPEQLPAEIQSLKNELNTIESPGAASAQSKTNNDVSSRTDDSSKWAAQGLCRFCGGKLSLFGNKCKSCGKKN